MGGLMGGSPREPLNRVPNLPSRPVSPTRRAFSMSSSVYPRWDKVFVFFLSHYSIYSIRLTQVILKILLGGLTNSLRCQHFAAVLLL